MHCVTFRSNLLDFKVGSQSCAVGGGLLPYAQVPAIWHWHVGLAKPLYSFDDDFEDAWTSVIIHDIIPVRLSWMMRCLRRTFAFNLLLMFFIYIRTPTTIHSLYFATVYGLRRPSSTSRVTTSTWNAVAYLRTGFCSGVFCVHGFISYFYGFSCPYFHTCICTDFVFNYLELNSTCPWQFSKCCFRFYSYVIVMNLGWFAFTFLLSLLLFFRNVFHVIGYFIA